MPSFSVILLEEHTVLLLNLWAQESKNSALSHGLKSLYDMEMMTVFQRNLGMMA